MGAQLPVVEDSRESADVVIAGGGPAGLMCGYLLARAGIDVIVLEKHADFLRDFRGDTVHPSTLTIFDELGLLDALLARPHQKVQYAEGEIGDRRVRIADFTHLPVKCPFIAFMPQWEFLDFLADHAKGFPTFRLLMQTEATDLITANGRVTGVTVRSPDGTHDITARQLVIAADGRDSRLRSRAGLEVQNLGAPMDVLWFTLPSRPGERPAVLGRVVAGQIMVMLYRGDYWQCALIIRKGTVDQVKREGLPAFRARVAALAKRDEAEIESLDDVRVLTVRVDRLVRWSKPGLLVIGDAAHAMSPIGGVGINYAIGDAVEAANVLSEKLRDGLPIEEGDLAQVQERREGAVRKMQRIQAIIQQRVIGESLRHQEQFVPPLPLRILLKTPFLRDIPARVLAFGLRPYRLERPEEQRPAR
jgi:2-polyprenyl-6-methoxyphenol hydroxylase-like FAD-dependent oxidoreductase